MSGEEVRRRTVLLTVKSNYLGFYGKFCSVFAFFGVAANVVVPIRVAVGSRSTAECFVGAHSGF